MIRSGAEDNKVFHAEKLFIGAHQSGKRSYFQRD
jgi:hypothetical protein